MSDPAPGEAIQETLTDLQAWLKMQPKNVVADVTPLDRAAAEWVRSIEGRSEILRPLLDLRTIPALVHVNHPRGQGLGFFFPVLAAWIVLAVAEFQYQGAKVEQSFFVWWSSQGWFGPSVYSGIIAALLLVVLIQRFRAAMLADKAHVVEARLLKDAANLALDTARLLDDHKRNQPLDAAAGRLTMAGDRLLSVAASMKIDPEAFSTFAGAAESANQAVGQLDTVTRNLASQVQTLTTAMETMPHVMSEWEGRLAPVRETLGQLTVLAAQSQDRAGELDRQLQTLASDILPKAVQASVLSGDAAQQATKAIPDLVAVAQSLSSAVATLSAAQENARDLIMRADSLMTFLDDRLGDANRHATWPPKAAAKLGR